MHQNFVENINFFLKNIKQNMPKVLKEIKNKTNNKSKPLNSKERRKRTSFSMSQIKELEKEFNEKKYLSLKEKSEIANKLGLSEIQVKVWFQNRR